MSCGIEASIHCFKILNGIEPYFNDILILKFSISFFSYQPNIYKCICMLKIDMNQNINC